MSDPAIHLKLDRILAGQEQILTRIAEQDETIGVLTAAATVRSLIGRYPLGSI